MTILDFVLLLSTIVATGAAMLNYRIARTWEVMCKTVIDEANETLHGWEGANELLKQWEAIYIRDVDAIRQKEEGNDPRGTDGPTYLN